MSGKSTPTDPSSIAKLSLRQLEGFVAVAEEGHVGRAATRLGIAQPPLSRTIHRLEATVGTALFDRAGRHIQLTEAGRAMLEPARRAIRAAERAIVAGQQAAAGELGDLHLGFASSAAFAVLPDLLYRFRMAHPGVGLALRERTTTELHRDLRSATIDVALLRGPVDGRDLIARQVHREEMVIVLPREHRLASHAAVRLAELGEEPFILFPSAVASNFHRTLLAACARDGLTPRVEMEAAEWHTIIALVSAGLGITLAPTGVARAMEQLAVAIRPIDGPTVEATFWLAHLRDEAPPPVVTRFMDLASETPQPPWS